MTSEENGSNGPSEGKETPIQLPEYAVPTTVAVAFMVVVAILYFGTRGHDHVSEGRYVGPGKCRECHGAQYDSWEKTRMANSFDVLRPGEKAEEKEMVGLDPDRDYTNDVACLLCHTTGYGSVGGFVSIEETPEMVGVSCEACHGHGGGYVETVMDPKDPTFGTSEARSAGLVYPPTEIVCQGCHNAGSPFVEMEYEFDYDGRVTLGTHEHYQLKYEHSR